MEAITLEDMTGVAAEPGVGVRDSTIQKREEAPEDGKPAAG
jgi:hypothetical protein